MKPTSDATTESGSFRNHPHWDHAGNGPPPEPHWSSPSLERLLQRAHLPTHPAGPLVLIALGLGHCLLVTRVFDGAYFGGPAFFAYAAFLGFALAPGLGLVATGAWDLARIPLHRLARRRGR